MATTVSVDVDVDVDVVRDMVTLWRQAMVLSDDLPDASHLTVGDADFAWKIGKSRQIASEQRQFRQFYRTRGGVFANSWKL